MTLRILVTGAAGFIGAHAARQLALLGHQVVGCDNFNDYYDPRLKHDRVAHLLRPLQIPCAKVDVADLDALRQLMRQHRVDTVLHLAAQAGVRHSLQAPQSYLHSNLLGFGQVLEACRRQGVAHLVYASSSSVYGARHDAPFKESDRCDQPVSLYAATKLANELMASSHAQVHGLRCTGLRLFTVYGPWGRPDMACFSFARKLRQGEVLPLFEGGTLWRDFTYVDDTVQAICRLLQSPALPGQARHEVFNIGHHQPVQVKDFVQVLAQQLGCTPQVESLPMQPGDVPVTCADNTQLLARLGHWAHTPLADGLGRFARWLAEWEPLETSPLLQAAA